jgi:ABC-type uncharacterized transport system involved in gliding motility auxiliary subunit
MSEESKSRPSFSPLSRWKIGFDVAFRTLLVLAVAVMVNWLGAKFPQRAYWSEQTRVALSSRTLTLLRSLTNHVEVTLYYDTRDPKNFYPDIIELLNAYRDANKNISIRTVDYTRDPAEALKVKEKYNLPASIAAPNAPPAKDLIVFASGERHDFVPGAAIVNFQTVQMPADDPNFDPNEKRIQLLKKPVTFNGEMLFTAKIFSLAHNQPLQAYFLQGHGEPSLTDDGVNGYKKFALTLAQNDIMVKNLELSGLADVPEDCNLLVIAGPVRTFRLEDLDKLDRYLAQGGKMLTLFNFNSRQQPTGLESVLKRWGISVIGDYIIDRDNSNGDTAPELHNFNPKSFVSPLAQFALQMVLPRPLIAAAASSQSVNAPQVEALVATSENSVLAADRSAPPRSYPLIASVEQKPVAGATTPRGITRIVIAGDSYFLDNEMIEAAANRDFLNYTANWLASRDQNLTGISPRPVTQFRLTLSSHDAKQLRWLLLGAVPGGILVFGWLVWLVRRK